MAWWSKSANLAFGGLFALVLSGCAALDLHAPINTVQLERELERLEASGFAGQVVVVQGDEVLLNRGYGNMAPGSDRAIDTDAVMPLASVTKPLTASAVFALAAEGRLGLDDPIGDHIPGLSEAWSRIPIRHFMTHTAGLPAEIVNRAYEGEARFEPINRDELLRRLAHFEPDHPPGEGYNYSNVGYNLLAVLVEVVAEESWEAFVRGSLLATAGVDGIGFLLPGWPQEQLVVGRNGSHPTGHYHDQPRLDDGLGWHLRGAGDLLAQPAGIIAWWQAIRHETWLSAPWLEEWLTPQVNKPDGTRYGYGLHFRDSTHGPVIGHTGGDYTFAVDFSWFTELDLLVYIATANARFEADVLRDDLHRQLPGR
jgi:CubicO group peptidase (beta-lactamase class C family)